MLHLLRVAVWFTLVAGWPSSALATSKLMQPAVESAPTPAPGKALVVFIRTSGPGRAISASIYDAPDAGDTFVGILKSKDKLAYQAEPGPHRFMVIGENADFLDAVLDAGRTYYVLIKPRMGAWKARFSLRPIRQIAPGIEYTLQKAYFEQWDAKGNFVDKTPAAEAWYLDNKPSVDEKKADYLRKWETMAPEERAERALRPEDGLARVDA